MKHDFLKTLGGLILTVASMTAFAAPVLRVADFGALPNDGKCDMQAIHAALEAAVAKGGAEVHFDAGTYNLKTTWADKDPKKEAHYLHLFNATNVTLVGACDSQGRPATRLERNFPLSNEANPTFELSIDSSRGVTVKNFVLANNPPFGSTGKVISSDKAADEVVVEVLPGLPAFDGMRCASAHAWDLTTGRLKRFGATPAEATLTIGTAVNAYWKALPGSDARRLKMSGHGFAAKVQPGDGITWHVNARDQHNQTTIMRSQDITLENIIMPNVTEMGMLAGYNRNLTFKRVRFEPENGNLAIGSRDGMHLSMNSGKILVEDCLFKGLRMDPLVLRVTFGLIKAIPAPNTIVVKPGFDVPAGDSIRFWVGAEPQDRVCTQCEKQKDGTYRYTLAQPAPREASVKTPVTFRTYGIGEGVIRHCVFEQNFGSAIVNFEENITVEGCTFRDNSYQLKFGANQSTGAFVRNNVFRSNLVENVSWIDIAHRGVPACLTIHSLNAYFKNPKYNQHVQIVGNTFKNSTAQKDAVAVHILNATDIQIRGNRFEGFAKDVLVDPQTTSNIQR